MSNLQKLQAKFNHEMDQISDDRSSLLTNRLFSLLLFSIKPLSLQEMADKLEVSKAAVSVRIRELEKAGMCIKTSKISDRRDYYQIAHDYSFFLMGGFLEKMNRFLKGMEELLQEWPDESEISEEQIDVSHIAKQRVMEFKLFSDILLQRLQGFDEEWEEKRKEIGRHPFRDV
ncbi:GbsR/MarR family transcriptional regulator [Thermoflavimicrobium daqui]|uniref:HTH marR-type domain-containing protein n=1 Tax=Thermoflavimicrobium daqui TaxID=2137476 RepID=A0A364K7J6_9BACL|nr:MarR family transcriptional regulator [Thermoflavimicrobium daqui]RAL26275.1 hypothetical protein DL897_04580 [Thermoflavimicrobium daqui]